MSLKFWLGPAGSGKSTKLYNYMIEESMKHPEMLYYIIAPEQANLQTQQKIVSMHPRRGILNIDVLSFNRLAHRIFEETGYGLDGGRVIDDMGKNLVLRRVSQLHKEELSVLGENLSRLGYITQVKSVISEFMQYGISLDTVSTMASEAADAHKGQLSGKLNDVSKLYEEFLSFIKDHYTTREELMIRLSGTLPESQKIKKTVIAFDGFTGFTPVQIKVIEQLLVLCPEVHVVLNIDKRSEQNTARIEEHELFYLSRNTIQKLGSIADKCHIIQDDPEVIQDSIPVRFTGSNMENIGKNSPEKQPAPEEGMLAHLERNIFRENSEKYDISGVCRDNDKQDTGKKDNCGHDNAENIRREQSPKEKKGVHILCSLSPDDELEYVAEKISSLAREGSLKYSDIAIITGDIEIYRSSVERALKRHDIPFFTDKTQPILLNPMIEYLRAAISVLSDNYTYESVFRLLKSGLTDIASEDIDEFENYVIAMGIRGRSGYRKVFARLPKTMRDCSPDDKAQYLMKINDIRLKVAGLFDDLEADIADSFNAGTKASVRTFAIAFVNMLIRGGIADRLSAREEAFSKEGLDAQSRVYGQIYERTMKVFEQMVELLGDEIMNVREFGQLLDAGLDEIRIGIIPGTTDYVQVGDITRSRVGDVKALFLVGVNDGLIPQGASSGGLLTDDDRNFFLERHSDMAFAPTARENAYTQRLYLYMILTKPSEYLYLSYSKINRSGESIRASYIIRMIKNMFPGIKTETEDHGIMGGLSEKKGTYRVVSEGLNDYLKGNLDAESEREFEALAWYYCSDDEYRERAGRLLSSSSPAGKSRISDAAAAALYGHMINTSVTRLETYAKCAYEYYLQYGLKLKDREVFDFTSGELGTVFHAALELYTNKLKENNIRWHDITDEQSEKIMNEAVEHAVASQDMAALYSTRRQAYMVKRIKRIMSRTASVLKYQAAKGKFEPYSVEVDFNEIRDLNALNLKLSDEDSMRLYGRIDRIDTCSDADTTYVRVIDYKSGNTSLDIEAVYEGRQLQLVVYMDTALEMIGRMKGDKTIPAGILYYHIDDPLIKDAADASDEEIEAMIRQKLKMTGYVNRDSHVVELMDAKMDKKSDIIPITYKKDGEPDVYSKVFSTDEYGEISKKAREKMTEMGRHILGGDISTAKEMGYLTKYPDTCDYCDYKAVCRQKKEDK